VFNPNTGEVQARVQFATEAELDRAVQAALRAQATWALVNPRRRARVMFEFKRLVEARMNALAELLSSEHGKVIADSKGDIQRGLEVIEFACGIPHALKGEYTEGAGPGIDVYSMRQPLGVCAGITPFNFPAMIPMWMFGVAIATGNTTGSPAPWWLRRSLSTSRSRQSWGSASLRSASWSAMWPVAMPSPFGPWPSSL